MFSYENCQFYSFKNRTILHRHVCVIALICRILGITHIADKQFKVINLHSNRFDLAKTETKYAAPQLNKFINQHCRQSTLFIMLTCPCNEDPLTPYFYIVKLGFTRIYIFLTFAIKHTCRLYVLVRSARVPTIYVLRKNKKKHYANLSVLTRLFPYFFIKYRF